MLYTGVHTVNSMHCRPAIPRRPQSRRLRSFRLIRAGGLLGRLLVPLLTSLLGALLGSLPVPLCGIRCVASLVRRLTVAVQPCEADLDAQCLTVYIAAGLGHPPPGVLNRVWRTSTRKHLAVLGGT